MKRRLLNFLTALSLLLCVATAALWVRSYFRFDAAEWGGRLAGSPPRWRVWWFQAGRGGAAVTVNVITRLPPTQTPPDVGYAKDFPDPPARVASWSSLDGGRYPWGQAGGVSWLLGFGAYAEDPPSGGVAGGLALRQRAFIFPYWAACLLCAALPTFWLVASARRRRRLGLGLCPRCGYDLRASPGRCPECGTLTPAPPAA